MKKSKMLSVNMQLFTNIRKIRVDNIHIYTLLDILPWMISDVEDISGNIAYMCAVKTSILLYIPTTFLKFKQNVVGFCISSK